eukprot:s2801_g7.t1
MLRCTLCIFLLRLALTRDVTLKEKELKVLRESVEAASIVRVRGQYNINGTCSWPDCAPVCEACDTKAMGTCMIPGVNECPWSSKCTMGTCFCSKGYCGVDSTCKFRTCTLGAQPPPYVAGNLVQEFASLGGEIPPYNAEQEEWVVFMNGCGKLPMFVLCLGMSIAILTCVCICCQLECECSWFPTAPVVLLSLCGVTVAVIVLGIVTRPSLKNMWDFIPDHHLLEKPTLQLMGVCISKHRAESLVTASDVQLLLRACSLADDYKLVLVDKKPPADPSRVAARQLRAPSLKLARATDLLNFLGRESQARGSKNFPVADWLDRFPTPAGVTTIEQTKVHTWEGLEQLCQAGRLQILRSAGSRWNFESWTCVLPS